MKRRGFLHTFLLPLLPTPLPQLPPGLTWGGHYRRRDDGMHFERIVCREEIAYGSANLEGMKKDERASR